MFRLKACPRCRGDLREDRDKYGNYATCLQCGYHQSDSEDMVPPPLPLISRRGRPRKNMLEPSLN
jgi:hypothetical protein